MVIRCTTWQQSLVNTLLHIFNKDSLIIVGDSKNNQFANTEM